MTAPSSLAEALAALQGQLPHVAKDQTAKVDKDGRTLYSYKYADLTDVTAAIMPLMAALGLSFTCAPTMNGTADNRFVLRYELRHVSGDATGGDYPLPTSGSPQDIGKAITYARRYALCAVTGLAPGGDDTDAASNERNHQQARKSRQVPDADLEADGRMTRAQKSGHEHLTSDTLRGSKRADRSHPRAPDPDDPWAQDAPVTGARAQELRETMNGADPEDKAGSRMPAQARAIEMLLGRLGIPREARGDRHEYVRALLALDQLASMDNLSYTQAADAIRLLSEEAAKEKSDR